MKLRGIHHITAITSSAEKIYHFFTRVLGMRLVKKTINQDDIRTYHLFFADERGTPGTDMTFFDFPRSLKGKKGTNGIAISGLRVPSNEALHYWMKRFDEYDVKHSEIIEQFGRKMLPFQDFDGQLYRLVSDEGIPGTEPGTPWKKGPVPGKYAIHGLGPVYLKASAPEQLKEAMIDLLGFEEKATEGDFSLLEVGNGGNGGSVIIEETYVEKPEKQGYGNVHHVAFGVKDTDELEQWMKTLQQDGVSNSGVIDRFYFQSLYTRLYPGILFELATEGPGFIDEEESLENLGETLALPPAFKSKRSQIEKLVRPIDTSLPENPFEKEYHGFE